MDIRDADAPLRTNAPDRPVRRLVRRHPREATVNYRTITIGEICWIIITVFVVLAYFNGWG
jgi:hypothetical protein